MGKLFGCVDIDFERKTSSISANITGRRRGVGGWGVESGIPKTFLF